MTNRWRSGSEQCIVSCEFNFGRPSTATRSVEMVWLERLCRYAGLARIRDSLRGDALRG